MVEEDTFYDVNGFEVSRTNLVQQMIELYEEKLELNETKVTDFNEGSEIRNLLESVAVDIYDLMENQQSLTEIAFVETAEGEWLDKHGANPYINLPRDTGEYATGFVTFTIPAISSETVVIPEATMVVSTDNGLSYITDSEAEINVGDTTVLVSATCLTVGEDGNCEAGTITLFDDTFYNPHNIIVNNEESFTGGADYEEDEVYRQRLLDYVRKDDFGSFGYYQELGAGVDGVHDVNLVDDNEFTKLVVVNGFVKPTPDNVLSEVLNVFTDTNNIILGHSFDVTKPIYIDLDLTANITVSEIIEEEEFNNIFNSFFNGEGLIGEISYEGLGIGETLQKEKLYNALYLVDEVEDVTIINNDTGEELVDIRATEISVFNLNNLTINQTLKE